MKEWVKGKVVGMRSEVAGSRMQERPVGHGGYYLEIESNASVLSRA